MLVILVGMVVVAGAGMELFKQKIEGGAKNDKYSEFVTEVYDKIQQNYWEKITDDELSNLFGLATKKITGKEGSLKTKDKNGVLEIIKNIENKEQIPPIIDVVLANLKPFERSRLYSQKEEKTLANNVNNIDEQSNYMGTLGIGKSATDKEVAVAYENKIKKAKKPEDRAKVEQAYKVLKEADSRNIYELYGAEPTIDYKLLTPNIYYIHLTKFSPLSLNEFVRVIDKVRNKGEELDTLIFDLRGNIGGAIDQLPYFLGPFIGPDNYAYQFYHQGVREDFKTTSGWLDTLVRYKKVIILIDGQSQSTAEVTAAVLKKYNVGVVVGKTTKGWGTVERVIPLEHQISESEKYSLFLVHHVTLREDGQPIEGRGVDPMISITDPNWKKDLYRRFNDQVIVNQVADIFGL